MLALATDRYRPLDRLGTAVFGFLPYDPATGAARLPKR
jgi:hypothetical protein